MSVQHRQSVPQSIISDIKRYAHARTAETPGSHKEGRLPSAPMVLPSKSMQSRHAADKRRRESLLRNRNRKLYAIAITALCFGCMLFSMAHADILPPEEIWGISENRLLRQYSALAFQSRLIGEHTALYADNVALDGISTTAYFEFDKDNLIRVVYVLPVGLTDNEMNESILTLGGQLNQELGQTKNVTKSSAKWENKTVVAELRKGKFPAYNGRKEETVALGFTAKQAIATATPMATPTPKPKHEDPNAAAMQVQLSSSAAAMTIGMSTDFRYIVDGWQVNGGETYTVTRDKEVIVTVQVIGNGTVIVGSKTARHRVTQNDLEKGFSVSLHFASEVSSVTGQFQGTVMFVPCE